MAEPKKTRAPRAQQDPWWWGALIVALVCAASVLVFAPEATIDKLFRLLERMPAPAQLATVIGAIATAVAVIRNRGGGGPPPATLALLGCLGMGGVLVGCGTSPVGAQYQALRVAATIFDSATDGAEAALTTQAEACEHEDACLDRLLVTWTPARAAQGLVLLALQGWASVIRLWEAAGDLDSLMRATARQVRDLGRAWNAWAEASAAAGWLALPPLPPEVITVAGAIGGE